MSIIRRLRTLWWLSGQSFNGAPVVPALKQKDAIIIEKNEVISDFAA